MEGVIKAIEKLAEKNIIDYLLVIVPIAVSIVAMVISITISKKQNKIALFERRYNCLFQIKTLLAFSKSVEITFSREIIIKLFDSFWGTNIANLSGDDQLVFVGSQIEIIKKDVEQATFLFKYKFNIQPKDIVDSCQSVLMDSLLGKSFDESRNEFISKCEEFKTKDLDSIQKFVKL